LQKRKFEDKSEWTLELIEPLAESGDVVSELGVHVRLCLELQFAVPEAIVSEGPARISVLKVIVDGVHEEGEGESHLLLRFFGELHPGLVGGGLLAKGDGGSHRPFVLGVGFGDVEPAEDDSLGGSILLVHLFEQVRREQEWGSGDAACDHHEGSACREVAFLALRLVELGEGGGLAVQSEEGNVDELSAHLEIAVFGSGELGLVGQRLELGIIFVCAKALSEGPNRSHLPCSQTP